MGVLWEKRGYLSIVVSCFVLFKKKEERQATFLFPSAVLFCKLDFLTII